MRSRGDAQKDSILVKNMVKAPCIKVEKQQGAEAITVAKSQGLLSPDLGIKRVQDHLCIPLIREPRETELIELKRNLPRSEILQCEFQKREKPSPKLVDLLGDNLPPSLLASLPHAIDFVGDIAVVEVPPELEAYKAVVGKTILTAHKRLNTVLAKSSAVGGEYRTREFETIAGVNKTKTVHREHGCVFHVDLARAYFSPRLSYEHSRVASLVVEGETVLDMFAGVGPFSVLIARKYENVRVYAVDKNPEAIQLLKKNMAVNRVAAKITPILGDARQVVADRLKGSSNRVIMNLPEKAIEYVDAACRAIKREGGIIHYYEFSNTSQPLETAKNRLTEAIKHADRRLGKILLARIVRGVAPFNYQVVVDAEIR